MINWLKKNKTLLVMPFVIFLLSRLFIFIVISLQQDVAMHYPKDSLIVNLPFIEPFCVYDSHHYYNISNYGYNNMDEYLMITGHNYYPQMEACYFPLYPILMKILSFFFCLNSFVAGFIISNLCFLLALIFIKRLLMKKDIYSNLPLLLVAFAPASMFFSAVYTESLFLLLVVLTFNFCLDKKWWAAGITGFLGALTRNAGVGLCALIFFEYLRSIDYKIKKIRFPIISAVFPCIGLIGFMIFEYFTYGDFGAFYHYTFTHYARKPVSFLLFLVADFLFGNMSHPLVFLNMLTCYLFSLAFIIMLFDKDVSLGYKIFAGGILYLSMSTLYGFPLSGMFSKGYIRYTLPCLPIFIYSSKRQVLGYGILGISIYALYQFTTHFAVKGFIA